MIDCQDPVNKAQWRVKTTRHVHYLSLMFHSIAFLSSQTALVEGCLKNGTNSQSVLILTGTKQSYVT